MPRSTGSGLLGSGCRGRSARLTRRDRAGARIVGQPGPWLRHLGHWPSGSTWSCDSASCRTAPLALRCRVGGRRRRRTIPVCGPSASSAGPARSGSAPASRWVGGSASAARPAWRAWWPPWPSGAGRASTPSTRPSSCSTWLPRWRGTPTTSRRRSSAASWPRPAVTPCGSRLPFEPAVVVWVPPGTTSTDQSRAALSHSVAFADAVFNVGRTALLVAALAAGNVHALRTATEDRLHQDQRFARSPGSRAALEVGARGRRLVRLAVGIRTDHRHAVLARGGRSAGGGLARPTAGARCWPWTSRAR